MINELEVVTLEQEFEKLKAELERAKEEFERKVSEVDEAVNEIFRRLTEEGKRITDRFLLNQILDDYIQKKQGKGEMEIVNEVDIKALKNERIVFAKYGKYDVILRIIYKGNDNFQILNCELYIV